MSSPPGDSVARFARSRRRSLDRRFRVALVVGVYLVADAVAVRAQVTMTRENTLTYNHKHLTAYRAEPYVLSVEDGQYFQVVVTETDPTKFSYTVSALRNDPLDASGTVVAPTPVKTNASGRASVTMRHDRGIFRYRVSIKRIGGDDTPVEVAGTPAAPVAAVARTAPLSPEEAARLGLPDTAPAPVTQQGDLVSVNLYPVDFDVWVETRGWEVSFTAGLAFSSLTDRRWFINEGTDAAATDDRIERGRAAEDGFRPDIMALVNVRYPQKWAGIGLAIGLGTGDGSSQRWFAGPSYVFGKNLIFTGGWTGGRIAALPTGQKENEAPINGTNTLDGVQARFANGWFLGVGFTFAPRKDAFLDALTAATGVTSTSNQPPTVSAIPDQTVPAGASTDAIAFTVSDDRTKSEVLKITPSTSDKNIVPQENIEVRGEGGNRTVKVTAPAGATGTVTITLEVSDGTSHPSGITRRSFKVTVNNPPTVSDSGDRTSTAGQPIDITIKVGDKETASNRLKIQVSSNDPNIVPQSGMEVRAGMTDDTRTIWINPVAGQSGPVVITVTVEDEAGATASDRFTLTVNP